MVGVALGQLDILVPPKPYFHFRTPQGEFARYLESAINIPVETFAAGSGVLDKGKQIVVYCNSGGRSYHAYRKLQKLAYPDIAQMIFADWQSDGLPVSK